jgi:hypothetical protein
LTGPKVFVPRQASLRLGWEIISRFRSSLVAFTLTHHAAKIVRAPASAPNQFSFKHSLQSLTLHGSTYEFCVG